MVESKKKEKAMKTIVILCMVFCMAITNNYGFANDSLAAAALAGGVIKAKNIDVVKKYKRKDCPVCKGKGWYISGDDITKVPCGYCEEEKGQQDKTKIETPNTTNPNNDNHHRIIIRRR